MSSRLVCLGLVVALALTLAPATAEEKKDARTQALERIRALHERLELAPRDSYLNYAIATIARRAGIDLRREKIEFPLVPVVTGDPAQRTDLFGVTTGAHAIGESLQLTELMAPEGWESEANVPLESLVPPRVPTHEIDLPPDAAKRADPEANLLPADWLFLRVANGEALADLCREAEVWARHVLTFYHRDARAPVELGRAFERLGLPDPRRVPGAYAMLDAPFAVAMADPFLREGTAVVVIFPEGPVGEILSALVAKDRVSEDGRVTRYRAEIGGRTVLSTSRVALDRMKALAPADALASSPDYLDMRGRLPAGEDESAFVFLSDAFVRRLVGPRLKILESRRLRSASHLRTMVNASLLYAEEHGKLPSSLETLTEGGYLTSAMTRCPHGGTYELHRGLEPVSSVHGRLGALTPLLDIPLEMVTSAESRAYRRYARAYEALWQQYFDPVGVRLVKKDDERWSAETVILPLANSSLYRNLARLSGGSPVTAGVGPIAPETVFLVSTKLNRDFVTRLRHDPLELEERFGANLRDALLEGFGDRITVGLLDDRMLFDYDLVAFMGHTLRWSVSRDVLMAPLMAGLNLPAYMTVSVKDRERVEAFLEELRHGAVREAAVPGGGMFSLRVGSYALERESDLDIQVLTMGIGAFTIRLYFVLTESDLVVATRPEVVEAVVSGGEPDVRTPPYNLTLQVFPENWKRLRPDMLTGYEEAARVACLRRLVELEAFRSVGTHEAARALGHDRSCPDGGKLIEDPETGALSCSIHGSPSHPRQPSTPSAANPTVRLLSRMKSLHLSLRFEDDGLRLRLETR